MSGAPAKQPDLERSPSSFDFRTVRKFNQLMSTDQISEAVKLLTEDVEWHAFDGRVMAGRKACQELFEQQKRLGLRRRALSDWTVQTRALDEAAEDDLSSFTVKRVMQYDKPDCIPARVMQTMRLKHGLISSVVVELALWEPGLEPLEMLTRFASLRASKRDDLAMACLDPECWWRRVELAGVFTPPPEMSAEVIRGSPQIKQLWDEQARQGMVRVVRSEWKEEDGSALERLNPSRGGQVFSREMSVFGKDSKDPWPFVQTAQVESGLLVAMSHKLMSD
eukprot:CAMPEP_0175235272 /NCGR_PEP_ID=MMETSP0093-20121207/27411_1 /TAXON_ID=311494 /ORGANISM="Alexandrium monilatum, Strain CCMP3105" /LENGTH=278 /DNA_ID=CAMNT_0016529199 /DNA_START=84 /DNA_END=920 /DNA_ORIENTATION=+